ncbi:MMPL family transporter [Kineosporia sp. A_224]|uniref:MMPL family transporter n=1 Tax=Kineosporia sp. A_224 TaxID=1962180 RepID=UPI000B4B737C|nr:MMPL family transporter [Kineosporia sp. A_224]
MFASWGLSLARWRWAVLVLSFVAVAAAGVWGPGVVDRLTSGGFDDPGSPATRAEQRIVETVGRQDTDIVALYSSPTLTVDDPAFRTAVEGALATLPAADVTQVVTYWSSGADVFVSADRRSTYVAVRLADETRAGRSDVYAEVAYGLRATDPQVTTALGGNAAIDAQISTQVGEDLARAESLSAPLLVVLLLVVFGSAVAAGLPLLIGAFTVLGSFVAVRLITEVTEVSVFAINIITILGLGLSIDYALFVVSRFREQIRAGQDVPEALATTMATAGRTVAFSAVTVAVSMTGLLLFPQVFLRSMGFGGIAAVVVAATTSLTVLPALLAVLGRRVDALRIRLPRTLTGALTARRERRATAGAEHAGGWERLARSVMRRPVLWAGAVVAVLAVLGSPFLHVEFGGIDARALPEGAQGRVVAEALDRDFAGVDTAPIDVLVEGADDAALASFSTAVAGVDGVTGVRPVAARDGATLLAVGYTGGAVEATAREAVTAIRALPAPAGATVDVGGVSAQQVDLRASIARTLPWMALLVVSATFLLLFLAFGSLVLPLKAVVMNVLSLGAAFGVVTWIFQDGNLSGLLGFTSTGTVETTQPILMLAILFGLSMDYEVFLLSRIREEWDATGDNTAAVAAGLQRTGRIITSAALLLVVVIAAFSTSGITFIKLIGVGMAVAIVVDATVVRALLVPATMRLLGRANWWAPAPMVRWWERYGVRESDGPVPPRRAAAVATAPAKASEPAPEPVA